MQIHTFWSILVIKSVLVILLGSPISGRGQGSSSSPEETDDFVLVPSNIPSDHSSDSNPAERQ